VCVYGGGWGGGVKLGNMGLMILREVTSLFKVRLCTGNFMIGVGMVVTPPHVNFGCLCTCVM